MHKMKPKKYFGIGIHTVQDEINFWNQNMLNSPTRSDKDKAKAIIDIVEHLNVQIRYESFEPAMQINDKYPYISVDPFKQTPPNAWTIFWTQFTTL